MTVTHSSNEEIIGRDDINDVEAILSVVNTDVDEVGISLGEESCVTLSYRRPRRPPQWNYNLFCMIHKITRSSTQ